MFAQSAPYIIKIADPPNQIAKIGSVLLRAMGLTGVAVLVGLLAAALFAGLLIWIRSRS